MDSHLYPPLNPTAHHRQVCACQFWLCPALGSPSLSVETRASSHFCVCFMLGISNAEARQPGKAPNFSVNWTVGDCAIEVINATTGKDELGRPSRLCKHALYCRWMRVHGKVLRHPHQRQPTSLSMFVSIPPIPSVLLSCVITAS